VVTFAVDRWSLTGPSVQNIAAGLYHCKRCRPQSGSSFSTVVFFSEAAWRSKVRRLSLRTLAPAVFGFCDATAELMAFKRPTFAGAVFCTDSFARD
jgi:hypothetical protein